MRLSSIKMRLIASVLLVEVASALCGTGLALIYERHVRFHAFNIMLRGRADSLLGAVQDAEDARDNVMLDGTEATLPHRDLYEVWDDNLHILGHSPGWTIPAEARRPTAKSFEEINVDGRRYRTIRINGMRIVDPGNIGGGIPRRVTIVYGSPTGPVWEAIREAVAFYGLMSLFLVILTGLCMFWLLRRGLAPLDELAAQAANVSVTSWHFEPSDRIREITELAPLASALETVLQRLERSFNQQRQFVSDATHELKTAVAVVKSSLQLLTVRTRTPSEYQDGLARCLTDCERMEEIVAKMLTLARVEGTQMADVVSTGGSANLAKVVKTVVSQLASFAELRGVVVLVSVPESPMVRGGGEELELLCSNLLMNALQHTKSGGAVHVTAGSSGEWCELRIEDEGSGIEQEILPYIFDRFYRSDPSRSRHTGGTGLGLAISKAIVLKFHGTIEIKSKPGEGTMVIVRRPLDLSPIGQPNAGKIPALIQEWRE
ncbi:MAG: HAMP domain-containing sensor histidine kinase [Edaphobacter sp.]